MTQILLYNNKEKLDVFQKYYDNQDFFACFDAKIFLDILQNILYRKNEVNKMRYEHYRDVEEYFQISHTLSHGHFHRAIEVVYCLKLDKPVIINGEEFLLKEGELLFVPPFSTHIFPKIEGHSSLCVVFPLLYTDIFESTTNNMQFESIIFSDKEVAFDIYNMLLKLANTDNPLTRKGIYSYCLGKMIECGKLIEKEHKREEMFAINALTYLEKNYSNDISLESAASALGYSRCYFSALFKKFFNKGFAEYLAMLRVKKSLALLTDNPINTVAFSVGFKSLQNYYQNFKKVMGTTPAEYSSKSKSY